MTWLSRILGWFLSLWFRIRLWHAGRKARELADQVRGARRKKYLLTVNKPSPTCLCAEIDPTDRPCLDCAARLARGLPRHDVDFVTLSEDEFAGLRQTASQAEIDRLSALGLLPTTRREIAHFGECCPEQPRAKTGAHVHVLRVIDAAAHDEDVDVRGCPEGGLECGGLHLRGLRWYEGALCRFEVLDGPGIEDDALRAIADGEVLGAGADRWIWMMYRLP